MSFASGTGGSLKATDISSSLRARLALLTGSRDKTGRPVITFPPSSNEHGPDPESLKLVLGYLLKIPSDNVKELGFTIIIDMRDRTPWSSVKPILKVLDDQFASSIHTAYIIKPDKFWEKQKASFASAKYKFEVVLTNVDGLVKYVDPSQLTQEFDGTLLYDHDEWVEMRIAIENLVWRIMDNLSSLDGMRAEIDRPDLPGDANSAKKALDDLSSVKRAITRAPVEELEGQGNQLIHRLSGAPMADDGSGCGDSDYGSGCRDIQLNPDLQSAVPHLQSLLENLRDTRQNLYSLLQTRKQRVDQCFQLKLFQQDAEKMFQWIRQNVELFLAGYADIGDAYERAKECQVQHQQFSRAAMNVGVNVERIMRVAGRLYESGHYAQDEIKVLSDRLDRDWRLFIQALERRAQLLSLSNRFHMKAEQYLRHVEQWSGACRGATVELPYTVPDLEVAICHHQELMESITSAYTESVTAGKSLVEALKAPPVGCGDQTDLSPPPTPNYSRGAAHVLDLLHKLLASQRELEQFWQERRIRLHQRLALLLFQQDVQQVLDWLDQHGELFLRKNPGIGRTLQRSRALQRSHQHFQQVTQNTYRNAEKLLHAANELAAMGEAAPEEVYELAGRLKDRVYAFDRQVQSRRKVLDLAVLFHTHYRELLSWFEEVERADGETRVAGGDLPACEAKMEDWAERSKETVKATETTMNEGRQLITMVRQASYCAIVPGTSAGDGPLLAGEDGDEIGDSYRCIQEMLSEIERRQNRLKDAWQTQNVQLELAIQSRLFSQDCHMVVGQLEGWCEDMRWICNNLTPAQAEQYLPIQQENSARVHSSIAEIVQNAEDLQLALGNCEPSLVTAEGRLVSDEVRSLCERVRAQQSASMDLAQHTLLKLQQAVELGQLHGMASQALSWIQQEEQLLSATLAVPSTFAEAEQLIKDHEQFQSTVKSTHPSIVRVQERASALLSTDHYAAGEVHTLAEKVLARWRQLCAAAEDRHKLLRAAVTYYKTLEQVVPVLDRLESEYQKGEDCCTVLYTRAVESGALDTLPVTGAPGGTRSRIDYVRDQLHRHLKNKESFLKGCSLARKNCELFIKYIRRQRITASGTSSIAAGEALESRVTQFLEELRPRETRILDLWSRRKKQLDQCQQFVLFEASAQQVLDWVHEEGEPYLSSHKAPASSRDKNEQLLQEHESFKIKAKEQRERVRVLCQIQDGLPALGASGSPIHGAGLDNAHRDQIRDWVAAVQNRYQDLASRLDRYRADLLYSLGKAESSGRDLALDRLSDSSLDNKLLKEGPSADKVGDKRKSVRKIELVMQELINTERTYIKDLENCINNYFREMQKSPHIPADLRGKEEDIFLNIVSIWEFHKGFVEQLVRYEALPEDVGHCFVAWAEKLQALYVPFCKNKEHSNRLVMSHAGFFQKLQEKQGLSLPLPAYLIKPVQRIVKYEQLLDELIKCSSGQTELKDAREFMHNVPLRANDILHLNSLDGCADVDRLGDFLLTDTFTVWYPKHNKAPLFKKAQVRRVFLFETCLIFSKIPESGSSNSNSSDGHSKARYVYKHRVMISEINLTEHVEGDECKFAVWPGPPPPPDEVKTILKASSREVKESWVRRMKELKLAQVLHFEDTKLPHAEITLASKRISSSSGKSVDSGDSLTEHRHVNKPQLDIERGSIMERSASQPAFHLINQPQLRKLGTLDNVQGAAVGDTPGSSESSRLSSQFSDTKRFSNGGPTLDLKKLTLQDISGGSSKAGRGASDGGSGVTSPSTDAEEEPHADLDMPPPMGALKYDPLFANPPTPPHAKCEVLRTEELAKKLEAMVTNSPPLTSPENGCLPSAAMAQPHSSTGDSSKARPTTPTSKVRYRTTPTDSGVSALPPSSSTNHHPSHSQQPITSKLGGGASGGSIPTANHNRQAISGASPKAKVKLLKLKSSSSKWDGK